MTKLFVASSIGFILFPQLLGIALYSIVARLLKSREKADKLFLVIAVIVSTFIIGLLALLLFLN